VSYLSRVTAALASVFTPTFWTELAEASLRQAFQIVVPLLVAVQAAGATDAAALKAAGLALVGGEVVVVVRRLAALTVPDGADFVTRTFARALSAFAGAVAGFTLAVPVGDVVHLSWATILVSAASSAALALLHAAVDPAASEVHAV
jgi:hypothetical protein